MKNLLLALFITISTATSAFGSVSEDINVYVRKDVYEAHQQSINSKLNMILEQMKVQREEQKEQINELRGEMKELREELKAQRKDINELARVVSVLSTRIDGLDARMGDQQNYIYLVLVILGIIVALPTVQKMLQARTDRSWATLEDVMRLIEENNSKTSGKVQA